MSFQKTFFISSACILIIASFLVGEAKSNQTTCQNFNVCANVTASFQGLCVSNCTVSSCQNTNGGIQFCATCNGGGFKYCNNDEPPNPTNPPKPSHGSSQICSILLIFAILLIQLFLKD